MSTKEAIVKDAAKYNAAHYGAQVFGFVTSIAIRRFLGPYLMGIWSLLRVVLVYCTYGLLGVNKAAAYKIPFYSGKGDEEAVEEIKNSTFGFIVMASIVTGMLLLVIFALIFRKNFSSEFITGICVIAIYVVLQRIYLFCLILLRATKNFSVVSRSIIFDSILHLVLVFLLVRRFELQGMYITVILLAVANTLYIHSQVKYKVNFSLKLSRIGELIKFGSPLIVIGFMGTLLKTVDRIMIADMLGITFVGYYSVGVMTKTYARGVINNFSIVTLPRMMEIYGKEEKTEHVQKFVTMPIKVISLLLPPILGAIFFVAPLLVRIILPQFVPGILVMQILLVDAFFISCVRIPEQFLVSHNKQVRIMPISLAAVTLNIALNYTLIKRGFGIYGVAAGTAIASLTYFLAMQVYAMKHFATTKSIIKFVVRVLLPMLYMAGCVLALNSAVKIENIYFSLFFKLGILGIVSIPLLVFLEKETGVLGVLARVVGKKLNLKTGE